MNKYVIQKRKIQYYLLNFFALFIPRFFYRVQLNQQLKKANQYKLEDLSSRINYYNRIEKPFRLEENALNLKALFYDQFKKFNGKIFKKEKIKKRTTYFFDLYNYLSYFPSFFRVRYKFGDITEEFTSPTIVKSRPINGNQNSVIMKLNQVRHFYFIEDRKKFIEKKNMAVWRGNSKNSSARLDFIKKYHNVPIFDIGQHNPKTNDPWFKGYLPIREQLNYKFIFCIEGADTATNIKWVMSSNSLCVMPKPKYETWFMEGKLIKDFHYIEVEDDFSNAEEKIKFYSKNIDKSLKIMENAHDYVQQFKNRKLEKLVSILVLDKFFKKSDQSN